ncbi:MAG: GNAT family N-acetyltransferase [Planctomycetales bacterium]|nr:GNAT family N-acetyltransferase [Planctomycetales bacterium]
MNFERICYDRPRRQSQVTYLEMFRWEGQAVDWPPDMRVDRVPELTAHDYRLLYNRVGADHEWTDRNRIADEELLERISGDQIVIHVLREDGKVAGYSEVRLSLPDEVELVYFGLAPEYRGRGLGKRFLAWTLNFAWSHGPARVWLHTCDRDHQAAIPNYEQAGFRVFDRRWE